MNARELIASTDRTISTRIDAVIAGNFDDHFIITDSENTSLDPAEMILVTAPDFLATLRAAGVPPRGGGNFAFGGPSTIDGTFSPCDGGQYPLQMTSFTFIEMRRKRRPPIRIFPLADES